MVRPVFGLERVGSSCSDDEPIYRLTAPGIAAPVPVGMLFLGKAFGLLPFGTTFMVPNRKEEGWKARQSLAR